MGRGPEARPGPAGRCAVSQHPRAAAWPHVPESGNRMFARSMSCSQMSFNLFLIHETDRGRGVSSSVVGHAGRLAQGGVRQRGAPGTSGTPHSCPAPATQARPAWGGSEFSQWPLPPWVCSSHSADDAGPPCSLRPCGPSRPSRPFTVILGPVLDRVLDPGGQSLWLCHPGPLTRSGSGWLRAQKQRLRPSQAMSDGSVLSPGSITSPRAGQGAALRWLCGRCLCSGAPWPSAGPRGLCSPALSRVGRLRWLCSRHPGLKAAGAARESPRPLSRGASLAQETRPAGGASRLLPWFNVAQRRGRSSGFCRLVCPLVRRREANHLAQRTPRRGERRPRP